MIGKGIHKKALLMFLALILAAGNTVFAQGKLKKRKYKLGYKQDVKAQEHFIDGVKYLMLEDNARALKMFRKAIQLDFNNAAFHHQVAKIYEAEMNFDLALSHARFALEQDDSNPYHYLSLSDIYIALNKRKESVKVLEKLVKKFDNQDYTFELAQAYYDNGDFDKCLKLLEEFEEEFGTYPQLISFKQNIYRVENKVNKAIEEGEKLIETDPTNPQFVLQQMDLYISAGMDKEAEERGQQFIDEQGDEPNVQLRLSGIQKKMGKIKASQENYIKAFENPSFSFGKKIDLIALQTREIYFAKTSGKDPKDAMELCERMCKTILEQYPDRAKSYAVNADMYGLKGDKKNSRDYYVSAVNIDDSDIKVWEQLILIDAELEQYDSLIVHTERALEVFPNQGIIWYFNGSAHLVERNFEKSVKGFERAKKLSKGNTKLLVDINAQLGDAYHGLKEYEKSFAAYDEVLASNPNNEHVLNNYSYHLSQQNKRLDDAYTMSKRIYDRRPDNSTYIDTHAWVLYKMKKYKEARELLEKIQDTATNGEVVEHYGDVLFQLGEKDAAIEQWKKALELGGGSDLLKDKIAKGELYE